MLSYLNLLFLNILYQIVFYSVILRNTAFKGEFYVAFTVMCIWLMPTSSRTSVIGDFTSYASSLCLVVSHLTVEMSRRDIFFNGFLLVLPARQNLDKA